MMSASDQKASQIELETQLENLEGLTLVTLPNGSRIWACPYDHLADIDASLSDEDFLASVRQALDDVTTGRLVEYDPSTDEFIGDSHQIGDKSTLESR